MKLIAVDWGSSSFRAYLLDNANKVVERVENHKGVLTLNAGSYVNTLLDACGEWLKHWPHLPVVMAGMIGSRSGWAETSYVPCPVSSEELSLHLHELTVLPGVKVLITPGVSGFSPSQAPDVMRGEEAQIFGALQIAETTEAMLCLPGTHSKWAHIDNNSIIQFSTFFTGEIFSLLQEHRSIGAILDENTAEDTANEDAFVQGVEYSRTGGGFLHHIFSARAHWLTNSRQVKGLSSYLSGIAIGHEFSGAIALYGRSDKLLMVGNNQLQQLYQLAAAIYDCQISNIDADQAFVAGLCSIAGARLAGRRKSAC